ncbi:alpha/beta hydrolase [Nocardia yunnanensis]|uniref:Alpha/beta hydrolase n=1 Tax=Nocardia yunnanensis TaxID=2382165 RepID=A0A386ZN72_9NOCA|nr:alpha/beta hydrolase [Nocardia yunnanensis]AYF78640.1 alpha/beta hydrolase [Nocardia yunnanensis]
MVEFPESNVGPKFKGKRVGYFRETAGFERYRAAYVDGFEQLPQVRETVDVPTGFGTVRAYRFGAGDATPLVLLPGRQAATPLWAANLPGLMGVRPVITLDLLGEPGASVQTKPLTDEVDQAAWLSEALAALESRPVHVLGVSIGGWAAANLAVRHPERVASLILLDSPFVFGGVTWKMITVSLGAVLPGMPDTWRSKLLSWISGGVSAPEELPEGRLIASGMKDFAAYLPMTQRPAAQRLSALTMPILGIYGGRSIVQNARKTVARARKLLPGGQFEVWPEASHAINGEFPDEIAARVAKFLGASDA